MMKSYLLGWVLSSRMVVVIIIISAISFSTVGCKIEDIGVRREREAISVINKTANWFITEGIADYYKDEDFEKIRSKIQEFRGVISQRFMFSYEPYGFLNGIHLEKWWLTGQIILLSRIQHKDRYYEFWFVTIQASYNFDNQIRFIVAETSGLTEERRIILRKYRFFSEFELPDGTKLKFPPFKTDVLLYLRPSDFPTGFIGTEWEGITEIETLEKLQYALIYFSVSGTEFKNATVLLDDKVIGKVYYRAEIEKGLRVRLVEAGIKAGRHNIAIIDDNDGTILLEIDVNIPAGENYVHYSPDKNELNWNDTVYKVIPGKPVIVK